MYYANCKNTHWLVESPIHSPQKVFVNIDPPKEVDNTAELKQGDNINN